MNGSDWFELFVPIFLLGLFVLAIFGVYRFKGNLVAKPNLTINSESNVVTSSNEIELSGTTDKKVNKLTVNNNQIRPDGDGNFKTTVPLQEGANKVVVSAYNLASNANTKEITVTKEPAASSVLGTTANNGRSLAEPTDAPLIQDQAPLSTSGPAQTLGILGLALLITQLFIYKDSKTKT